tara:strand:+ start:1166 stop:1546 length:381 start_codon:yes stop_codon:yes gene_type:complete
MKFYCKLKPSTKEVLELRIIGDDVAGADMSAQGEEYCHNTYGGEWKQTSKTGAFRKNYAGVGWFYHADIDAFVSAQPYPSWILDESTGAWNAPNPPGPMPFDPDNTKTYTWDEDTKSWIPENYPEN